MTERTLSLSLSLPISLSLSHSQRQLKRCFTTFFESFISFHFVSRLVGSQGGGVPMRWDDIMMD